MNVVMVHCDRVGYCQRSIFLMEFVLHTDERRRFYIEPLYYDANILEFWLEDDDRRNHYLDAIKMSQRISEEEVYREIRGYLKSLRTMYGKNLYFSGDGYAMCRHLVNELTMLHEHKEKRLFDSQTLPPHDKTHQS